MFDFTMKQIPRRNPLVPADIAVQVQEWKILGKPRQGGIDWNLASWAKDWGIPVISVEKFITFCTFG